MQWRSGLTLWFAKPPFAGSTPACISKVCEAKFTAGAHELLHVHRESNRGREVFCFEYSRN